MIHIQRVCGSVLPIERMRIEQTQEGGYSIRNLRRGAPAFFNGFAETVAAQFNGKKT
jgi:hypothetical protein